MDHAAILRRFEKPDEVRTFPKGRFEIIRLGDLTIGCATYQPGWKWSVDVGPSTGKALCEVEHVGFVLAGHAVAVFQDGKTLELTAGTAFYIPSTPHDSWVIGNDPYISLHLVGADHYTR